MAPPGSRRWAYVRIMAGTILGGGLGFYVMHRIEISYKERMEERLRRYEAHMLAKAKEAQELQDDTQGPGAALAGLMTAAPHALARLLDQLEHNLVTHSLQIASSLQK